MTKDDIIKLAREAGCVEDKHYKGEVIFISNDALERFAQLVRNDYSNKHAQLWLKRIDDAVKEEREACAKVCDELQDVPATEPRHCAQDIRARGQQ